MHVVQRSAVLADIDIRLTVKTRPVSVRNTVHARLLVSCFYFVLKYMMFIVCVLCYTSEKYCAQIPICPNTQSQTLIVTSIRDRFIIRNF